MGMEVGWSEMLVIAIVMIVVVGPKDLPKMLRSFGRTTAKLRQMAGDFQKQFNEALEEAELDDVKKTVDDLKDLNPATQIRKHINPFEKAASDVRAGLNSLNPTVASAPPASEPRAAEPLKNGPTEMPAAMTEPAEPKPPVAKKSAANRPRPASERLKTRSSKPPAKPKART